MKKEKQFFINGRENEVLLKNWETSDGYIATDRITVDGLPVGYMYREKPEEDSSWEVTEPQKDFSSHMMLVRQRLESSPIQVDGPEEVLQNLRSLKGN